MDLREAGAAAAPRHPWEAARRHFFAGRLRALLPRPPAGLLDVGAGDAWLAAGLYGDVAARGRCVCWDTGYADPATVARLRRRRPRLHFTAAAPRGRFGLITALDVLEHVEDAAALLRALVTRHLAPGGHLLVSVPAWPWLFSEHDRFLQHHRRYTPAAARALVRGAGLRVRQHGGLFHALLPLRAAAVAAERAHLLPPARGLRPWRGGAALSAALRAALRLDGQISAAAAAWRLPLPGLSWWALCAAPAPPLEGGA